MNELFPLEASWIVALASSIIIIILLLEMAKSLPGQNILLIVVSLLVGEGLIQYFMTWKEWIDFQGPKWAFILGGAWLWLALVLLSRRLAKLIFMPWRQEKYFGLWVLGGGAALAACFQYGWPCLPGAIVEVGELLPASFQWPSTSPEPPEYTTVLIMTAIRGVSSLILLAALFPWFIRKRPTARAEPSELAQQPKDDAQQNAQKQAGG